MLFAKDNSPSEIAGAAAMGERTPADRNHCGRHN